MSLLPLLQIKNVGKYFGDKKVLDDVSIDVFSGEVVSLIGPSGSGKTTALRCMNFLEQYNEGEVWFDGQIIGYTKQSDGSLKLDSEKQIAKDRRPLSMVFQQFNLWPHMTVLDNVRAPLILGQGLPKDVATVEAKAALAKVGLAQKEDAYPAKLSGGQQQRVGIARALAVKPQLMLLDEPTSALDPELVEEVLQVIRNLANEGMTMVMVTHEMSFAAQISSKIVFMENGKIIEQGAPIDLFENTKTDRLNQFLTPWREKNTMRIVA